MSDGKYYITTPIYYVNFKPHIGTSYTTILTDVVSRYRRFSGEKARLVTGSDEHSQNIADLAAEAKTTPLEYCNTIIPQFKDCWKLINIQDYRFERTSSDSHYSVVQKFWQAIYDRGDVYKGEYSGWYHTSDNRFLDEDEVPDEPEKHPRLKHLTEEAYYFKLSAYQDWVLAFHEANPQFVIPDFRRNEMLNRIGEGLRDICISRTSTEWGIPLPWDKGHVFYVWVEALLTYLTGSGFDVDAFLATVKDGTSSEVRDPLWQTTRADLVTQPEDNHWPADLHVMAKDIPWFHAVIWPAMLASFGAPPPKQMLVHGYWQFDGEKMSKSLGNVVDPYDAAKLVSVDGLRYFLMREVPAGRDGNFNYESLVKRYNFDLVNDLGNLVHRTISLVHQQFDGVLPDAQPDANASLEKHRVTTIEEALGAYERLEFSAALKSIWTLVREGNKYVAEVKPWELKKHPERAGEIAQAFHHLVAAIRTVVVLAYPVIPESANKFWQVLGLEGSLEDLRRSDLDQRIVAGHKFNRSEVIFNRVDVKKLTKGDDKQGDGSKKKSKKKKKEPEVLPDGVISIDDFAKVELRLGQVKSAAKVEKADKLLQLKVFDGERERQIIAGIAQWYAPEELVGKRIVIVANLKPAKLRGLLSEGMILAAEDSEGRLSVMTPEREVSPGARVR